MLCHLYDPPSIIKQYHIKMEKQAFKKTAFVAEGRVKNIRNIRKNDF